MQVSQAQFLAGKIVPHGGFSWEFYTEPSTGNPVQGINIPPTFANYYTFGVGAYYVLGHRNDVVSFGVDPNFNFGFRPFQTPDNRLAVNYLIQVPVYVMGRVGAGSTPYNTQALGAGIGIGGIYSYLSELIAIDQRQLIGTVIPAALAEVTWRTTIFRFHFALAQPNVNSTIRQVFTGQEITEQIGVGNFGFGLIYKF